MKDVLVSLSILSSICKSGDMLNCPNSCIHLQTYLLLPPCICGLSSHLGIAEFLVPTGSFFHAQTHVSFHVMEELSPNVRMIRICWSYLSLASLLIPM